MPSLFDAAVITFAIELVLLYLLSRVLINEWYLFLRLGIKSNKVIFGLIALFFLPGTIVHELSHYFAATILFLKVHEVVIIPTFEGNRLKMGHVTYEKTDLIRSVLVGIAPFFGAMGVFIMIDKFNLFPGSNIYMTIIFGYLIFTIAIQMFSSHEDLVDLVYLIPLGLILYGISLFFDININFSFLRPSTTLLGLIKEVQFYITSALIMCVSILFFIKSCRLTLKK